MLAQMRVILLASSFPFFATAFFSFSSTATSFDSVAVVGVEEFEGDDGEGARKGREVVSNRSCSGRVTNGASGDSGVRVFLLSSGANLALMNGEREDDEVRQVDEANLNHAGAEMGGRAMLDGS